MSQMQSGVKGSKEQKCPKCGRANSEWGGAGRAYVWMDVSYCSERCAKGASNTEAFSENIAEGDGNMPV
jgi:hypothetical protein